MARDFDGVGDQLALGSDASIDAFVSRSVAMWLRLDSSVSYATLSAKDAPATLSGFALARGFGATTLTITQTWDGNAIEARWNVNTDPGTTLRHVVVTYNNSSAANDPAAWIDGASSGVTETVAPGTTADSDAAKNLVLGLADGGGGDLDGLIGFYCYDNTIWDAAMVNRHRWWGSAPGGPSTVKVWHPFWTDQLNNKGTATANATATGTTVNNASVPKVERCWAGLMGVGR